jgi:hypothetical protein
MQIPVPLNDSKYIHRKDTEVSDEDETTEDGGEREFTVDEFKAMGAIVERPPGWQEPTPSPATAAAVAASPTPTSSELPGLDTSASSDRPAPAPPSPSKVRFSDEETPPAKVPEPEQDASSPKSILKAGPPPASKEAAPTDVGQMD